MYSLKETMIAVVISSMLTISAMPLLSSTIGKNIEAGAKLEQISADTIIKNRWNKDATHGQLTDASATTVTFNRYPHPNVCQKSEWAYDTEQQQLTNTLNVWEGQCETGEHISTIIHKTRTADATFIAHNGAGRQVTLTHNNPAPLNPAEPSPYEDERFTQLWDNPTVRTLTLTTTRYTLTHEPTQP